LASGIPLFQNITPLWGTAVTWQITVKALTTEVVTAFEALDHGRQD
jgi:hypothetical protein